MRNKLSIDLRFGLNLSTLQAQCGATLFPRTYSMIDIDDLVTNSSCRATE